MFRGVPKVCDINNNSIGNASVALKAESGCKGGKGFLCDSYIPSPATDILSYGFAIFNGVGNCCKCFQLTWTSRNARGKQMIVQALNTFDPAGDVKANDVVILAPGGGSGPNETGCRNRYGTTWYVDLPERVMDGRARLTYRSFTRGQSGGGVASAKDCANLPQNLQGGCYWRYNWAGGPINTWGVDYQQVACPARLTSISGCVAA